jgi:hypothetical protein
MKNRTEKRRAIWALPCRTSVDDAGILRIPVACIVALLIAFLPAICSAASPESARAPIVLRGNLESLPGNQPVLQTGQKSYKLAGQSPYLLRTLQDKRLLHQEFQVVGTAGPNGDFVVQRLFAVRNGKLYKVEYYCEVCNITYVQPGHCVCCGRETKLKEVPVGEAQ